MLSITCGVFICNAYVFDLIKGFYKGEGYPWLDDQVVHDGLFNKFMCNQLVLAGRMLFNGFKKASVRHNVLMINRTSL